MKRIFSKIGLNKAQIVSDTRGAISTEKIDEYIMAERSILFSAPILRKPPQTMSAEAFSFPP